MDWFTRIKSLNSLIVLFSFYFIHTAAAEEFNFLWTPPVAESSVISHRGGQAIMMRGLYNNTTQRFLWEMTFSPSPSGLLPNGFYMVVNTGFSPKGHQGEMALLYFDGADPSNLKLTAYAYNGQDAGSSWQFGNLVQSAPPDRILSSLNDKSWIKELKMVDSPGLRRILIDVDVTAINNHSPLYPTAIPWLGTRFGKALGFWIHPVANLMLEYSDPAAGGNGYISKRNGGVEGFYDQPSLPTQGCDGVIGSGKQIDVCGVCGGNGSTCGPGTGVDNTPPQCTRTNLVDTLLEIDSRAAGLRAIGEHALIKLKRLAPRSTVTTKFIESQRKALNSLYVVAWQNSWAVPQTILSCPGELNCSSVSFESSIKTYIKTVSSMRANISRIVRKLREVAPRRTGIRAAINSKADQHLAEALKFAAGLPLSTNRC